MGAVQCNHLPPGSRVITPANGTILGAQSWFLLLADWVLRSGYSQVGLGNGNLFCWPYVYLLPLPPWPLSLWAHWWKQECLGKETDGIHRMCHPVHVNFESLFCWGHPLVNIHMGNKHLHLCSVIQRDLPTCLFLKPTHHQFFNHVFSKSLIIQPNNWPQSMNIQYPVHNINCTLGISCFKQNEQRSALLNVLPTGRTSPGHRPLGMSSDRVAAVLFGGSAHCVEPPINQGKVFSSSVNGL